MKCSASAWRSATLKRTSSRFTAASPQWMVAPEVFATCSRRSEQANLDWMGKGQLDSWALPRCRMHKALCFNIPTAAWSPENTSDLDTAEQPRMDLKHRTCVAGHLCTFEMSSGNCSPLGKGVQQARDLLLRSHSPEYLLGARPISRAS